MNLLLQRPECSLILEKIKNCLPAYLHYHNLSHTLDVCKQAEQIALQEKVASADIHLLLVAAAYHDAGYLQQAQNHEEISCGIAGEMLPQFGYAAKDIQMICSIIMATKLPQKPQNLLESIICDADLDYLGREDFFEISKGLYQEMQYQGMVTNEAAWDKMQVLFLENHHYFTTTAIQKRAAQKAIHLDILKHKLIQL